MFKYIFNLKLKRMTRNKHLFFEDREKDYYTERAYIAYERELEESSLLQEYCSPQLKKRKKVSKKFLSFSPKHLNNEEKLIF